MIANARMYAVSPLVSDLWRGLLGKIGESSGLSIDVVEHGLPAPMRKLWQRPDKAAVFMCGLPYSLAEPRPTLIAAPVPSVRQGSGLPEYWSEIVVRADSDFRSLEDTFGHRLALTTRESQSGCFALLHELRNFGREQPLFEEIIPPQITPRGALTAVIEGRADVAPIDSFAYELLEKWEPGLIARTRVVARTTATPIPPLVASFHAGLEPLQRAFLESWKDPNVAPLLRALLIERFVLPDQTVYDILRERHRDAVTVWHEYPLARSAHPEFVF